MSKNNHILRMANQFKFVTLLWNWEFICDCFGRKITEGNWTVLFYGIHCCIFLREEKLFLLLPLKMWQRVSKLPQKGNTVSSSQGLLQQNFQKKPFNIHKRYHEVIKWRTFLLKLGEKIDKFSILFDLLGFNYGI